MSTSETPTESMQAGANSEPNFFTTFVAPALWMFAIPVAAFAFFQWAEHSFDVQAREAMRQNISSADLPSAEKQQYLRELEGISFSRMARDPQVAASLDPDLLFQLAVYRWMIWIASGSIIVGIAGFAFSAGCAMLLRGDAGKIYLGLSLGWNVLRIISALQVVAQAVLAVAMSYWVTALWFNVYIPKLILFVAIIAGIGVIAVIRGIFKRPQMDMSLEGELVTRERAPQLWQRLEEICDRVGTEPPTSVVAGIDDNFFVTEQALTIGGKQRAGRTLYVSLSLLRQLDGAEADAVMAHEMAHFSGNDTTFSNKLNPLLARYAVYLQALYEGGITIPVYYFMLCFRAMYEYNLGSHSREREFRADRVAGDATAPGSLASALMKIVAYSQYRGEVERTLFEQHKTEEINNIAGRVGDGFDKYAATFAGQTQELRLLRNSHPFDSHPPIAERIEKLGVEFSGQSAAEMLADDGDGAWYSAIEDGDALERQQWERYENEFRTFHEQSLCYRFLPETEEEREIVVKHYPPVEFETKAGPITLDCDCIRAPRWNDAIPWSDVVNAVMHDSDLHIKLKSGNKVIKTRMVRGNHQAGKFVEAFGLYYGRYMAAAQYQSEQAGAKDLDATDGSADDDAE